MDAVIPSDIRERVADRMTSGRYGSEGDVLRDAMDALDALEEQTLARWHERNRMAESQSRQRLSRPLDDRAVLGRLRERLQSDGIID
ncbi:MAG: hypothetical protein CMJ58_06840 [Planctomycetaceae bacterium]|nr:hypothetical protein [Planctomycetaceae bacterium]